MAIEPIVGNEYVHSALVRLVPPLWGKPRIAALTRALINPIQRLENAAWQITQRYTIDGADTLRLDILGKVVGQPRAWADDEIYRSVIRAKIRANRSRGLTNDVAEVIQLAVPTTSPVQVLSFVFATILAYPTETITEPNAVALHFLLPKTRPAGVKMHFAYQLTSHDDPLAPSGFIPDSSVTPIDGATPAWSVRSL